MLALTFALSVNWVSGTTMLPPIPLVTPTESRGVSWSMSALAAPRSTRSPSVDSVVSSTSITATGGFCMFCGSSIWTGRIASRDVPAYPPGP